MKNLIGLIIVTIGSYVFAWGYKMLDEDAKNMYAEKFVSLLIEKNK